MSRVVFEGSDELVKALELLEEGVSAKAFKATARKAGTKVVRSARKELGKQGNFPDMDKVWSAIGNKTLRSKGRESIGVMVHVRPNAKYDGKLNVSGAAKLIEKGAYKNPERKGRDGKRRGNIQRYAKGDFIEAGFGNVQSDIEQSFELDFEREIRKRI